MKRLALATLAVLVLSTTLTPTQPSRADDAPPPDPAIALYGPVLLEIARGYRELATPDRFPRRAPEMCMAPRAMPPRARESEAADDSPHGKKLYYVFVRDIASYQRKHELEAAPAKQVLVKESWTCEPVAAGDTTRAEGLPPEAQDRLERDGETVRAGKRGPLFVMMKLTPDAAHSDAGWVYATLTPDGKEVTAAGRIASCMGCHVEAKHDRQFGLPGYNADEDTLHELRLPRK